jgi:hypothetical protein
MTMAHDLIIDQFPPEGEGAKHLATWYAQGHSDGLGDRLLMFDNTSAPSWEILRFKPALAREPRFEAAIKEQMERLASFEHAAFPVIRPITELGHEDGLAVVSTFAPGLRLSEALKKPRSVMFALRMVRQLVPAIAALQEHAPGLVHGALNTERVVVTAEGGLMIREHMVGAALASLGVSAVTLWSDFGILAPPAKSGVPALDSRSDVAQIGLVVLSLMAGRRIGPDEYPDRVEELLDGIEQRSDRRARVLFQPLRYWLQRALQLDEFSFESARDANDALSELPDETERAAGSSASIGSALRSVAESADVLGDGDAWPLNRRGPRLIASRRSDEAAELPAPAPQALADAPSAADPMLPASDSHPIIPPRFAGIVRWAAVAVAAVALVEAAFIARLLYVRAKTPPPASAAVLIESPQPGASVMVDNRQVGVTPMRLDVGPQLKSIRVLPSETATPPDQKIADAAPAIEQRDLTARLLNKPGAVAPGAVGAPRTGGFRLSSPVQVHVLDGERVLGSSADGPIVAPAGRHEYEFVNSAIGYRERRVVDVRAGQITSLTLTVPNGTLNINAVPWASVWIDGTPYGETPLGNLSVPPGEHEILFRHPQLGERREKTLVKADAATRLSVNLQRPPAKP